MSSPARFKRKASRIHGEATKPPPRGNVTPETSRLIPGTGYVIERLEADNFRSVMPLAGWQVDDDGELHALPRSLDKAWIVRPQIQGDDRLITTTVQRLRTAQNPFPYQRWENFA
jgi:hypothetical protein